MCLKPIACSPAILYMHCVSHHHIARSEELLPAAPNVICPTLHPLRAANYSILSSILPTGATNSSNLLKSTFLANELPRKAEHEGSSMSSQFDRKVLPQPASTHEYPAQKQSPETPPSSRSRCTDHTIRHELPC